LVLRTEHHEAPIVEERVEDNTERVEGREGGHKWGFQAQAGGMIAEA